MLGNERNECGRGDDVSVPPYILVPQNLILFIINCR